MSACTEVLGTVEVRMSDGRTEKRPVYVDRWQSESGKTLYTPRAKDYLGGRDFAHRSGAVRYARRVLGDKLVMVAA